MGETLGRPTGIDADFFENLVDDRPAFFLGAPLPDRERLHHDVANLATRVQRRNRILEDHLHVGADFAHVLLFEGGEFARIECDASRSGLRKLHDRPARGALAASGFAHDAESFPG